MEPVRVDLHTDAGPHRGVVRGLDQPLEAPEVHNDVVLHPLEGDVGDGARQLPLLHGDNVDVLGADDHVHRLVGGEPAVHTGELLAVHFHHVVADHGAV